LEKFDTLFLKNTTFLFTECKICWKRVENVENFSVF